MKRAPRLSVGWLTIICLLGVGRLEAQTVPSEHVPCTPWPATDALGRKLPLPEETGPPQADRFVGIFYFLTHQQYPIAPQGGPYDIRKIVAADPDVVYKPSSPLWGPIYTSHYWGEPLWGYYQSTDPWVLRRHAQLLADAGIDTLIFDTTNAVTYRDVYLALCEVFHQVRQDGGRTPQVAFMVNTEAGKTALELYHDFYERGLYRELWFHWQGKPLLLCDPEQTTPELKQFFTLRRAHWPFTLINTPYAWHWEATYPQPYGYTDDPNVAEQVNVSVAHNLQQKDGAVNLMSSGKVRGRSFHDGAQDTRPGAINYGYNFQEQWKRAFELRAPFVMVTGWNEWTAMRLGKPEDPISFCDQFDEETSRDIEPMRGGHGDNYYWQLVANVRRYKGVPPLPQGSAPKTIVLEGSLEQWREVGPEFLDHVGETAPRDHDGTSGQHYTNQTGRNDLVTMKVARDVENVYFYVRTREPITARTDPNWMWLLLDTDQNTATGWEGYDFIVNRSVEPDGTIWLEKNDGGWKWSRVAKVPCRVVGNELELAIPREALGLPKGQTHLAIDFKWADNLQMPGDLMDFYLSGDVAPKGRFRYRYQGE